MDGYLALVALGAFQTWHSNLAYMPMHRAALTVTDHQAERKHHTSPPDYTACFFAGFSLRHA